MEFEGDQWKNHGRIAAEIARPFLETLELDTDTMQDILYGIAIHVDDKSDFEGERTPFALTVGEADNIDRFDAYRLYETLENVGYSKLSKAEKRAHTEKLLGRLAEFYSMEYATATATRLWRERIGFYMDFYRKLSAQLDMSTGYVDEQETEACLVREYNENLIGLSGHF